MNIFRQTEKFCLQRLDFNQSVCTSAIWYVDSISVVPKKNYQLLVEKRLFAKFEIDISKTKELFCVYAIPTNVAKATQLNTLITNVYIYTLEGLRRLSLGITNFMTNSIYPNVVITVINLNIFSLLLF